MALTSTIIISFEIFSDMVLTNSCHRKLRILFLKCLQQNVKDFQLNKISYQNQRSELQLRESFYVNSLQLLDNLLRFII